MTCERCKNKNAAYHFKSSVNGKLSQFHLCSECAAQLGLATSATGTLGGIFGGFSPKTTENGSAERRVCPECGTHESDIASCGYVGCANCYKTFSPLLSPYIVKLHGKTHHTGKVPLGYSKIASEQRLREKEITSLRTRLKEAVATENYELAAELRDDINALAAFEEEHEKGGKNENDKQ